MDVSQLLRERLPGQRTDATPPDPEADQDFLCWGWVRGNRRAFSIEFRRLRGSWRALEYSWFQEGEWCPVATPIAAGVTAPAGSFILQYHSGHRVVVSGRNLRDIYVKVLEHQVKYLAEADEASGLLADAADPMITRLEVVEVAES
jgi:hypothetical protein